MYVSYILLQTKISKQSSWNVFVWKKYENNDDIDDGTRASAKAVKKKCRPNVTHTQKHTMQITFEYGIHFFCLESNTKPLMG